jgi:phosphoadenosine phosphosulfate reductase
MPTIPDARQVEELNLRFEKAELGEILAWAWSTFGTRAAIGTSFQGTGLVIMDVARREKFPFPVFTLDTGLLFPETLELQRKLEDYFQVKIEALQPVQTVEQQAATKGPELWKRDPDACCMLRKVEPLQQKLASLDCWITGLRRQQSDTRAEIGIVELYEFDPIQNREVVKINPMANWKREDVWSYIREHGIPYNPLQDQGYRSIGCVPCTAKTGSGEDERAGRWTGFNKTECGIHTFMKRKDKTE